MELPLAQGAAVADEEFERRGREVVCCGEGGGKEKVEDEIDKRGIGLEIPRRHRHKTNNKSIG